MNQTPGPWAKNNRCFIGPISKEDDQSYGMVLEIAETCGPNRHLDAEFIITACNAHEELVAELKRVLMNAKAPHATDWETVAERITHTLATLEKGA